MGSAPLPYMKIPIRAGRNIITQPEHVKVGGIFLKGGERDAVVRLGDYVAWHVSAHQHFSSFPMLDGPIFDAPWSVQIDGPASGSLILWTDKDVEVTWEAS